MSEKHSQVSRLTTWLEQRGGQRNTQDENALLSAARAYDATVESGRLTREHLQMIVEAGSSRHMLVWANSAELLRQLSYEWPEAATAIAEMSTHRHAHVRFAAICSLGNGTPASVIDAVLRSGFCDRSARVRWKAVDRANQLERLNLIPEITAALAIEPAGKARDSMDFDLRMLRDGYWVRRISKGSFSVTVRTSNGVVCNAFSHEAVQRRGVESIVAELRANSDNRVPNALD